MKQKLGIVTNEAALSLSLPCLSQMILVMIMLEVTYTNLETGSNATFRIM